LSDTTNLHANNDYGLQVIQQDSPTNYSNIMYIGSGSQTISGFSINPIAIHSSDKSLILSGSGEITGSQVVFTGGKIGGWDLSSTRIQSPGNTMRFTSTNPKITMETHTFEDGPGIQLGFNSGKVEFYAGDGDIEDAGTNYIKFHEDTGIDIQTAVFKLDTAQFDIDSATNSGVMKMGATPPSAYNSGNGIYLDGMEGSTGAGPHIAAANTGIPGIAAIREARRALDDVGQSGRVTLIYAGGVRDGADMAKALALGADAIAIGTGALIALNCNKDIPEANFEKEMGVKAGQCYHCHTGRCPVGVATQDPILRKRLNPDDAALRVYNYLHAMTLEAQLLARACGKTNIHSLEPEDLSALTMEASALAKVPIAGTNHTVGVNNFHKI